jgi:hypothetical protein
MPVVIGVILVVVILAGFFLFRATTAREEAKVDPNSPPIQAMRQLGIQLQQQGANRGAPPPAATR